MYRLRLAITVTEGYKERKLAWVELKHSEDLAGLYHIPPGADGDEFVEEDYELLQLVLDKLNNLVAITKNLDI